MSLSFWLIGWVFLVWTYRFRPFLNPFIPSSTTNKLMPWALALALASVIATTTTTSAKIPLVINTLLPFKIKSSPSLFALVRIPWRSDPASKKYKKKLERINYFSLFQIHVFIFKMSFGMSFHFQNVVLFRNVLSFSKCERFEKFPKKHINLNMANIV